MPWNAVVRPMSKFLHFSLASMLVLLPALFGTATDAQDQGGPPTSTAACLAFKSGLSLGASLAFTRAKLRAGGTLTIVALGSSSTTGFGAFGTGTPFPDVMKQELSRLYPSARIELINSGRIMEGLEDKTHAPGAVGIQVEGVGQALSPEQDLPAGGLVQSAQ